MRASLAIHRRCQDDSVLDHPEINRRIVLEASNEAQSLLIVQVLTFSVLETIPKMSCVLEFFIVG